jgi:hypothetical protein
MPCPSPQWPTTLRGLLDAILVLCPTTAVEYAGPLQELEKLQVERAERLHTDEASLWGVPADGAAASRRDFLVRHGSVKSQRERLAQLSVDEARLRSDMERELYLLRDAQARGADRHAEVAAYDAELSAWCGR